MFKFRSWFLINFVLIMATEDSNGDSRVVTIESGSVRGHKDPDYDIYVFNGIPYATAPTGTDKFKAPLPAPVWSGIFQAIDAYIMCPQHEIYKAPGYVKERIREDCLVANIYVPNTTNTDIPVLVDIHGGSYQVGYGNMLTLKQFADTKRVIVVNFNYRLGVHGFLCLGTKDIPGNAGMKDMVALLRWVKKNIVAFGGNPNEVTISEYSSGSSAVNLLLVSPSAKGLFHGAIPESGPNLVTFAVQADPVETAKKFARTSKFTNVDNLDDLENFYKTTPFESLERDDFMAGSDTLQQFTPCVERNWGDEPFLLESPLDILTRGDFVKVPILYGFSKMEKTPKMDYFEHMKNKVNEIFYEFLPGDLNFESEIQRETVAQTVKEFYFGDKLMDNENSSMEALVDYFTDVFFVYGTLKLVRLQVEAGNNQIYLYEYSYINDDENTELYHLNMHVQGQGALLYEVENLGVPANRTFSETLLKVKETVKALWINFITKGTPVPSGASLPSWPPANAEGYPYMSIGETLELRGPLLARWRRMNFWQDIYHRYYRNPVPPHGHLQRNEL